MNISSMLRHFTLTTLVGVAGCAAEIPGDSAVDVSELEGSAPFFSIKATDMVKTTGGADTVDGLAAWNVWANGSVHASVSLPDSSMRTIKVRAYGQAAGGVNPTMNILVDGVVVQSFDVAAGAWNDYSVDANLAQGDRRIDVAFSNDAITDGQDRNLVVYEMAIGGGGCSGGNDTPPGDNDTPPGGNDTPPGGGDTPPRPSGQRCVVFLHGRGGSGGDTSSFDGITTVRPQGNQGYDSGSVWIYFPSSEYSSMVQAVKAAIPDSCGQILLRGFSNGGAAASKMFCQGETFGGRLIGVVSDDPVMDQGTLACAPPAGVPALVFETGALPPGDYSCSDNGFTCEGGSVVPAATYVGRMSALASLRASSATDHSCHEGSCDGVPSAVAPWWK